VLSLGPATKVYLLSGSTDMRLGFEGLAALASGLLREDPLTGHLFVFCNKHRTRLKVLFWDGSGLWVCAKRLEKGGFHWPQPVAHGASRKVLLTQAELTLLLAGIDLEATRRRAWHRVE
jgi:transposase